MIHNSFEKGPQGWHSYDYHADVLHGPAYPLTTWRPQGGVNNSGYIWTDNARWSTDVPERPISILALIFYRGWVDLDPIDLRGAQVSVYLRGDDLHTHGASCHFWVHAPGVRWHFNSHLIEIAQGSWGSAPSRFSLPNDESLWHQTWSNPDMSYTPGSRSLDAVLGNSWSYGFSFLGFAREVHGRLSMDEFEITRPG